MQELRIVLPGVQVLVAFLLTVPFAQGFAEVDDVGRALFGAALVAAILSVVAFMTPTAMHRFGDRTARGERLQISIVMTRVGLLLLAVALDALARRRLALPLRRDRHRAARDGHRRRGRRGVDRDAAHHSATRPRLAAVPGNVGGVPRVGNRARVRRMCLKRSGAVGPGELGTRSRPNCRSSAGDFSCWGWCPRAANQRRSCHRHDRVAIRRVRCGCRRGQ